MKDTSKFWKSSSIGIIIIIVLFFSIKKTVQEKDEKNVINSNPVVTVGNITKYTEVGLANYYLTYQYLVQGKIYHKTVLSKYIFKNCQHDNKCIGRKIYVKYYADDCTISEPIVDSLPTHNTLSERIRNQK